MKFHNDSPPRYRARTVGRRMIATLCTAALAATFASTAASAQTAPVTKPDWPARQNGAPIPLVISAQKMARPALEFALLPKAEESEKGNAAMKYATATMSMPELTGDESEYFTGAARWAPLTDLREDDPRLRSLREKYQNSLRLLYQGSRMESADWETNIRREGISALLPGLTKYRELSTALALEIRFDIQRHDWPAAREKLVTGYELAVHLGEGETLIESLVGVAIAGTMNRCVEDWVAEPGSPNIYWPLSNLPAPFNNLHRPMWMERGFAFFSVPELKDMKAGHYSRENWIGMINRMQEWGGTGGGASLPIGGTHQAMWKQEVLAAAAGVAFYPEAKRFLVERGMTKEAVEAMPTYEALGRYFVRSYEEDLDEVFKWAGIPAREATKGIRDTEKEFAARTEANQVNLLARVMLPSLGRVAQPGTRVDVQIAMLRIIEALRAYAAEHETFPAKLADLNVPIPVDPLTGQAFDYMANGATASIVSTVADPKERVRYDLTLRK